MEKVISRKDLSFEPIRNNMFDIDILGDFDINKKSICGINFYSDKNEIDLVIYDDEVSQINKIDMAYNNYSNFSVIISFLTGEGKKSYSEKYESCRIIGYTHSNLSYSDCEPHLITISVRYNSKKIL